MNLGGRNTLRTIFLNLLFLLSISVLKVYSQKNILNTTHDIYLNRGPFNKADSLRGYLNSDRSCFDIHFYNLNLFVDINLQCITGYNEISFITKHKTSKIQLDLFENYTIDSVILIEENNNKILQISRDKNAFWVFFAPELDSNSTHKIRVIYNGTPREAPRAPWDGGFVWTQDKYGKPWVGVACEGLGASSWWPLKDHPSDEPDSMRIAISVPDTLKCISNGNLLSVLFSDNGYATYEWKVHYPINSYNITLNIGDYEHFSDTFVNKNRILQLDYYVLQYNKNIAKQHFEQVKPMLLCFEKLFGPYPFQKDGYALIETPYWGMEHQSAIAYGNNYVNNEWGFDYIIVHESAHEWFGNNITADDHADLWIQESFTTYAEALYVECMYGKKQALSYLNSQRSMIRNLDAIQGPRDINFNNWLTPDMYYKGAWVLHTLRSVIDNDSLWFVMLKRINEDYKHKTTNTQDIIKWLNKQFKNDYSHFFYQYLNYRKIPIFEYKLKKIDNSTYMITYKWDTQYKYFDMPIDVYIENNKLRLHPTTNTQSQILNMQKLSDFEIDTQNYYIRVKDLGSVKH